ncbi:MAG: o-succinylbenzoate--CoA ligase [Actinomycetota bacterium]
MSFPYTSIGFWLQRRAELSPSRTALVIGPKKFTYADLEERASKAAGLLKSIDVERGDRVATYLNNSIEYVDIMLACARIGAICVPLSTRLTAPELEFITNDAQASTLVYESALSKNVEQFISNTAVKNVLVTRGGTYDAALAAARSHPVEDSSSDETLAIIYTSGTTGRPKGAMLTHGNFFWTNLNIVLALDITEEERTLMVLPMFHIGGWNVNTFSVWWKGGTVYVEESFDPARTLKLIERERITSMMGVPTIYQLLADHELFASTDLSSVRNFVCGGAPLPVSLIERYQARGLSFIQGYGLTEAAPNCLMLAKEDSVRKAGAAGRPYFYADVRVVDEHDAPVKPGESGEIIVGGPSVMKGYWNLPEETAKALREGWLRTGDVGRIDEEGYITIVDRVKDMFISGGENVYPAEIEKTLASHPAIVEAAVIGVPDDRWGEAGCAFVVLRKAVSQEEIRAFCSERLAKFKVPRDVVFTDSLPRNATGKLVKDQLRRGL